MPGLDGTGPLGNGPRGKGLGPCSNNTRQGSEFNTSKITSPSFTRPRPDPFGRRKGRRLKRRTRGRRNTS